MTVYFLTNDCTELFKILNSFVVFLLAALTSSKKPDMKTDPVSGPLDGAIFRSDPTVTYSAACRCGARLRPKATANRAPLPSGFDTCMVLIVMSTHASFWPIFRQWLGQALVPYS